MLSSTHYSVWYRVDGMVSKQIELLDNGRTPRSARGQTETLLESDCVVVYRWIGVNVYRKSTDAVTTAL